MPDLFSIMETVESMGSLEDTRAKAAKVKGEDNMALLKNLYMAFHRCHGCPLSTTRRNFVFGEGPPNAKIMFVGDGPSKADDHKGRPFVGPEGQLLNRIINAMKLNRNDLFITNAVKCHPPNRSPLPDELNACSPLLERQIEAVNPQVIITMGPSALRFFKGDGASLLRERGQFFQWKEYTVMPTFHPAYILRNPRSKREVWEDLRKVIAKLN